jgi:hypothetical protein
VSRRIPRESDITAEKRVDAALAFVETRRKVQTLEELKENLCQDADFKKSVHHSLGWLKFFLNRWRNLGM